MNYAIHFPDQSLSPFIKYYWFMSDVRENGYEMEDLLIPDGQTEIIFNNSSAYHRRGFGEVSKTRVSKSCLVGQRKESVLAQKEGKNDLIGVKLRPGALGKLTGIPENHLSNQIIGLNEIGIPALVALEEKLFQSSSIQWQIPLLDETFIPLFNQQSTESQLLTATITRDLEKSSHLPTLDQIRIRYNLHHKKLERLFHKNVGLSPKSYLKVLRFKKVYKYFNRSRRTFYDGKIFDLGYYDQTHFIKEFKFFTGDTPTEYYRNTLPKNDDILIRTLSQMKSGV